MEKEKQYERLARQAAALMEGERSAIPNLANLSALLFESLEGLNWAGFYLAQDGELVLGPFQGRPACIRIPWGKGVCGMAAATGETQVVPDVHSFPGHIACDGASRSEIVVPLLDAAGTVLGVMDLDSPLPACFDKADAVGLERVARLLEAACGWN